MEKSTHTKEYDLVRAELKAARESAQLTQRALAARLGVPHSWVAKVEAGERRVDLVELCWYLDACGRNVPQKLKTLAQSMTTLVRRRQTKRRGGS
jgi:transcriptional regulator with XRE-family HTH domain